jgi:hypothetical protein
MTTIIDAKEAMVRAYLRHEAYKADIAMVHNDPSSSDHVTRSGKMFRTTDVDVNAATSWALTTTTHDFIVPGVMDYLDIRAVLRLGATCKSNRAAAKRVFNRRRELVKESIDEIHDAIEAMIRNPRIYCVLEYEKIDATDDTGGRTQQLTRACRMRTFAIDVVRVLLGLSYDVAKTYQRTTAKTRDVDYVHELIKRQNYSLEYYLDSRSYHEENMAGDEENMTDDDEDEEYADESEDEGEAAMQLSDEGSNIPYEDRSMFDSEDDELWFLENENMDENSFISGGDGGFKDFKMSKRDLDQFRRMLLDQFRRILYPVIKMAVNIHDDAMVALNGAMYLILVKKFMI